MSKQSLIIELLEIKPMTTREIVIEFNSRRFDDYSFWTTQDVQGAITMLKRKGQIEGTIGKSKKSGYLWRLKYKVFKTSEAQA